MRLHVRLAKKAALEPQVQAAYDYLNSHGRWRLAEYIKHLAEKGHDVMPTLERHNLLDVSQLPPAPGYRDV